MTRILLALVWLYRRVMSPVHHALIGPCCRFEPTCSNYAIEAIRKKGMVRGLLLASWRLLRCNPWCKGGYDPVERPPGGATPNVEP